MSTIELFHATDRDYQPGLLLPALSTRSEFHNRQLARGYDWLENAFDAARPSDRVSRKVSRFACGDLGECGAYARKEPRYRSGSSAIRYYSVRAVRATKAPMALVGCAFKSKTNSARIAAIIEEYWTPSRDWNFWEYLCADLEIIGEVNPPDVMAIDNASAANGFDWARARGMWPGLR